MRLLLDAIGGIWLVWLVYWWIGSLRTKAVERSDGLGTLLAYRVPMVVGALLLIATGPPAGLARFSWLWTRWLPASMAWPALGLLLVAPGLAFACWARLALGRNWSAMVQLKRGHELIVTGPYRWTRHPIYTGMLLALLGTALTVGEQRGWMGFGLVFAGLWFKLRHEEAWMRECFGVAYVEYMQRVKALIPGVL
jgi:protein-S-isoprenylcysteine O-methyltransferase Ste14